MLTLHVNQLSPTKSEDKAAIATVAHTGTATKDYRGVQFLRATGQACTPTNEELRDWGLQLLPAMTTRRPYPLLRPTPAVGTVALTDLMSFYGVGSESSHPTLFWVPKKYLPLLKKLEANAAEKGKRGGLPSLIRNTIGLHYEGEILSLSEAKEILALRPKFPKLLAVPSRYTTAYRIITGVSRATLSKWGVKSLQPVGSKVGGTYKPFDKKVGCWTVDSSMFSNVDKLCSDLGLSYDGPFYNIIVACDLADQRDKFLFNPDTLPQVTRVKGYEYQKEIISTGPVALRGFVYFHLQEEKLVAMQRVIDKALALLP